MKIFEVRTASFSSADNDSVGGREVNRNGKGTIYIPTSKKAEAMAILASYGYFRVNPNDCRLASGNDALALEQSGIVTQGSLVFVAVESRNVGKAYFDKSGARVSKKVGRLAADSENRFKTTLVTS